MKDTERKIFDVLAENHIKLLERWLLMLQPKQEKGDHRWQKAKDQN